MAQETRQFLSRGSVKRNMFACSTLCRSNEWWLHSTHLKWSKDRTWVTQSSLSPISPFVRNLQKLESLATSHKIRVTNQSKGGMEYKHKRSKLATQHKREKHKRTIHKVWRTSLRRRSDLTRIARLSCDRVSKCCESLWMLVYWKWRHHMSQPNQIIGPTYTNPCL